MNILNKLEAVFFDLDGTLLDTSEDLLLAFNYILNKYFDMTITYEQLIPYISSGTKVILTHILKSNSTSEKFKQIYSHNNIDKLTDREINKFTNELMNAYHQLGHTHTDYFPGMEKVIELLNHKKINWGIITNKTTKLTMPVVDKFKLKEKNCKSVVCADTTAHAKPHPAPMKKACQDLNVTPDNCIFIGDAITDIQAGKSVNMYTVAASYGFIPPNEDIERWQADKIIKTPLELIDLISNIS